RSRCPTGRLLITKVGMGDWRFGSGEFFARHSKPTGVVILWVGTTIDLARRIQFLPRAAQSGTMHVRSSILRRQVVHRPSNRETYMRPTSLAACVGMTGLIALVVAADK